ncbi:hypothetical protein CCR75_001937 [Bremia lactucae]|uniref:Uncharacterized protein n=1 Tax=Bremia lactucae TaxID=4779 RepID=A0A976FQY2_BRELC|nr:hypothetical protein CCR75_001937 [Bremia lactucae]
MLLTPGLPAKPIDWPRSERLKAAKEMWSQKTITSCRRSARPIQTKKSKRKLNRNEKEETESVDDLLKALAIETRESMVNTSSSLSIDKEPSLFGVDLKCANADTEMKRLFGVKEGSRGSTRQFHRTSRKNPRLPLKKTMLVTPLEDWPRPPTFIHGGIRWTRSNEPQGLGWNSLCKYYKVVYSSAYEKSQEEFQLLQRSHDPNVIAHFLQRYPYHIEALVTMTEVYQHHGQMDHASDCIQRCIYALELAWTDDFEVTKGHCRMDIRIETNGGVFKALFLLMKQAGRRGCVRSAFETAKLVLGLDPEGDPMSVVLAIDYYALTSRQCQFVIDLVHSKTLVVDRYADEEMVLSKNQARLKAIKKDSIHDIAMLPNLQFSLGLAHFYLGNEVEGKEKVAIALLHFPTLLEKLLHQMAAISSSAWHLILANRVFAKAQNVDKVLEHLLEIYVTRNCSLWKVKETQAFLLQSAQYALDSPQLVAANPQVLKLPTCMHKYLRAVLADYSDDITTLPADHPMLQPPELENGQLLDAEARAALVQAQEVFDAGNLPADANPLLLFLQTLLPWNQVQGAGQRPPL